MYEVNAGVECCNEKLKTSLSPQYFVLQEKKFQCEAIIEKFGILNSLLELLELCQANLVQIKLMGSAATTPVYVFFFVQCFNTHCAV